MEKGSILREVGKKTQMGSEDPGDLLCAPEEVESRASYVKKMSPAGRY